MSRRPTLQDFIDDELLRAPLTFDRVIDAVQQHWRDRLPAPHSRQGGDPVRALQQHRDTVVASAVRTLRASAGLEPGAGNAPGAAAAVEANWELSLIGEADVAVDIEIARCVQTIRQTAEVELRELQTYTSALVQDINVARDNNPFGPERYARAMWAGVQQAPLTQPLLTSFLHEAALPLAQALRQTYASASQRLQSQGVAPAAYRTIVPVGSSAWSPERSRSLTPVDLHALHDSMPAHTDRLDTAAVRSRLTMPVAQATHAMHATQAGHATPTNRPDPKLLELLARLFTALQNDAALAGPTLDLLQRLQATVLRLALHDTTPLDTYDHPVWRFMDALAHDIAHCAPARQPRLVGLCRNLVDHLAAIALPEAGHFSWAGQRLAAARKHALAQAVAAAAPRIGKLQRLVDRHNDNDTAPTATMPLDIGTLDTVPAALVPEPAQRTAPALGAALLLACVPGYDLRVYLQSEWRHVQVLWQDADEALLLLGTPATGQHWALRQAALARLLDEGLARPLRVRSLVRRAANQVMHGL